MIEGILGSESTKTQVGIWFLELPTIWRMLLPKLGNLLQIQPPQERQRVPNRERSRQFKEIPQGFSVSIVLVFPVRSFSLRVSLPYNHLENHAVVRQYLERRYLANLAPVGAVRAETKHSIIVAQELCSYSSWTLITNSRKTWSNQDFEGRGLQLGIFLAEIRKDPTIHVDHDEFCKH
ncbi:hypothetical protein QQP08_023296 [Theobroma cacao]|nr:hypothetical protein QQP08_023296 [Theobroma cacao]